MSTVKGSLKRLILTVAHLLATKTPEPGVGLWKRDSIAFLLSLIGSSFSGNDWGFARTYMV